MKEYIMSNGVTRGNRPAFGGNIEATRASNPLNIRTGKESVRQTQDFKNCMKSREELEEYR